MDPEKPEFKTSDELSLEAVPSEGEQPPSPNGKNSPGSDSALGPAFDLERLLSKRVERHKREAEVDQAEFRAEHEPKRLRMNLWERGTFVAVLTLAAVVGAALIAIGIGGNLALVPPGCVLLSGAAGTATYHVYRQLKQRDEEDNEPRR